jgi:hypothetical protein
VRHGTRRKRFQRTTTTVLSRESGVLRDDRELCLTLRQTGFRDADARVECVEQNAEFHAFGWFGFTIHGGGDLRRLKVIASPD